MTPFLHYVNILSVYKITRFKRFDLSEMRGSSMIYGWRQININCCENMNTYSNGLSAVL